MSIDEFVAYVTRSYQQQTFFHFTDEKNLPLIRQHGLLSMRRLKALNVQIPAPGGNELSQALDQACGMDYHVHLCFMQNHPMVHVARQRGQLEQLKYLRIRPDVIKLPGAMITNGVANSNDVTASPAAGMICALDLEVIYTRTDWLNPAINARLQAAHKCEILIPQHVPAEYIMNLGHG